MNVFDGDLQIIYDLDYQLGKISLLILFGLFSFLYEICKHWLAVVLDLFFSSFDDFSVFAIPLGMWELSYHDLETLELYFYLAGGQGFPRDVHFETSKSTKSENEWEIEFLHNFFFESDVS